MSSIHHLNTPDEDTPLEKLKGLGPKSAAQLHQLGLHTKGDLAQIGPVEAFCQLKKKGIVNPSLNFLYAMVGALENKHWLSIAQEEKTALLLALDGQEELHRILAS